MKQWRVNGVNGIVFSNAVALVEAITEQLDPKEYCIDDEAQTMIFDVNDMICGESRIFFDEYEVTRIR